jgi:RHS repeat-associated protein
MEKDDEVKGVNNSYDFGARMYDNRLGRWLSKDVQERQYPSHSPYSYSLNSPVLHNDPNGEWAEVTTKKYFKNKTGELVQKTNFWHIFRQTKKAERTIVYHNAKVYNGTSVDLSSENMSKIAAGMSSEIKEFWSRTTSEDSKYQVDVKVEFDGGISVVTDLSTVKAKGKKPDNLFIIEEESFIGGFTSKILNNVYGTPSSLALGSNLILINAGAVGVGTAEANQKYNQETEIKSTSTLGHEVGHWGGLDDNLIDGDAMYNKAVGLPNDNELKKFYNNGQNSNSSFKSSLNKYIRKTTEPDKN